MEKDFSSSSRNSNNSNNSCSNQQNSEVTPSSSTNATSSNNPVDYLVEENRLKTFTNWPNPNISPQSLAKAGFYYLNRSDEVKCAWCKGVIAKWEKTDNAFEEHKRFFPDCPRVQLGPLIEMASEGIRDLGIQRISLPREPKYASLDARLRTYTKWPITNIQKPDYLALAGLYYQNVDDQVRCFHCNIGLRSWQKEDDPWFEHAKWFPQCQFVQLVKGPAYIQNVQNICRQNNQVATGPVVPTMTIDEAMTTSPVLQALEIGIDGGSIRNATQRQLLNKGRPYDNVESLLKAVFGDPDTDEDDEAGSNASSHNTGSGHITLVQDVSRMISNIFSGTNAASAAEQQQHTAGENIDREEVNIGPSTSAGHAAEQQQPEPLQQQVQPQQQAAQSSSEYKDNLNADPLSKALERSGSKSPSRDLSPNSRNVTLEEENRRLRDARQCKVCLDDEVGVVFLPCGHLVTCVQCAPGVNFCPMCRTNIKGFVRTYLA